MFPLALYVLEMAFFKIPLGKTAPELFYFTIVEAIRSAKASQFVSFAVAYSKQIRCNFTIQMVRNTLIPSKLGFHVNHTLPS